MKAFYRSSLPSLLAVLILLAACSPRYGAHFAPSKQAPKVAMNEQKEATETTNLQTPKLQKEPEEAPLAVTDRATAAGATDVISDVTAKHEEKAATPFNTLKEQRKVLRELKEKLKGMSQQEREAFKQQVLRQLQEEQLSMRMADSEQGEPRGAANIDPVLLVIITILLPPLGVYLHQGEANTKFWISLILTLLIPYIGGLIYSLLVIFDVI